MHLPGAIFFHQHKAERDQNEGENFEGHVCNLNPVIQKEYMAHEKDNFL